MLSPICFYVPQGPVQRPGTLARRIGAALGRAKGAGATKAVAGGDGEGDGMMFNHDGEISGPHYALWL